MPMSFDSVAHTNQFVSMRQKPFDVRTKASDVRQKTSDVRQKVSDEEVTLSVVADYPRIDSVREYRRKPLTLHLLGVNTYTSVGWRSEGLSGTLHHLSSINLSAFIITRHLPESLCKTVKGGEGR